FAQPRDHAINDIICVGRFFGGARDDQGSARLIDQNRVYFVYDREIVLALDVVLQVELHVVAQVVKPELVVLTVGNIGAVRGLALLVSQSVDDYADAQAEVVVDLPHPFGVAPRQVVVDRDHVHPAPGQRIQNRGQGGHQGFAFAGLHLGDLPLVQHHAADQLDVEVTLSQRSLGGLAHHREHFRQHVLKQVFTAFAVFYRADLGS